MEAYRLKDAHIVLLASGSMCGTIKAVIDEEREKGVTVGLLRLRMYRPFPVEKIVEELAGKLSVGVVDRSVNFGFKEGPICVEVKSLANELPGTRILSFIDGIASIDITKEHVGQMIRILEKSAQGLEVPMVTWINDND